MTDFTFFNHMVAEFALVFIPFKFSFKYLFFVQTQNQIHNNKFASVHKKMNATENILFDLPVTELNKLNTNNITES